MTTSINTLPKPFCFVLMPFSADFDDIYRLGIKDACDNAGAYCERVDEQIFSERIPDRIYNQIAKADLIVADMTGRNPNVFYEVGYAHALGKLTILLTKNADDIPFDLKPFPHIIYGNSILSLRDELEKRVQYFVKNPPTKTSDTKLELEFFVNGHNLTSDEGTITFREDHYIAVEITIFNASTEIFAPSDFQLGIVSIASVTYMDRERERAIRTKLPDNRFLNIFLDIRTLFPGAYTEFRTSRRTSHESW